MNRRGFSLVEVMIAIVALTVGVLALSVSSVAVTRLVSHGGRLGGAAVAAEGRIELLRATPCESLASSNGPTRAGAYSVSWSVTGGEALRAVVVTVGYSAGRGARIDTFHTTISCAP